MSLKTQKLYYTKYFCPETLQILVTADFCGVKLQLNQLNKKYDPVSLVTSKGVLNRTNSILKYLAAGTNLNGQNQSQRNLINTWYEYFNTQIHPLLTQVYAQIFGEKAAVQTKYTYCLAQITKNLKVLDDSLKIKTFFIGNSITIFDITLACYLENVFKLILTESERKKLINLFRWHNYIRQIPIFSKYLGKKILCGKQSFKIEFNSQIQSKKEEAKEKQETNETKVEEKKQKQKAIKKQSKKQGPKQTKKQQKIQQKKEQNPAQNANASNQFKFDDFKREFQNSSNQAEVLKNLIDNFNSEKLSIWKIHYLKDVTEGKVLFLTQNLANGSLQRIQSIRKSAFGSWGVYGEQENYEIRGVMIWQGTQIHNSWKQHPAFEYHQFTKLSPGKQQDRQIIFDYLLEKECAEGLMHQSTKRIL